MYKTISKIEGLMTIAIASKAASNKVSPVRIRKGAIATKVAYGNPSNCSCSNSCGSNFSQNGSCGCSSSCGSNYSRM